VEARLTGSSDVIRRGDATMFLSGDVSGCEDLLAAISAKRHHVGGAGMAARAKLATNLVLGLSRAALAEGMAFAEAQGLDRRSFLALVRDTPAASPAALFKGEKMASGNFTPDSRIRQHLKDVGLILAYGRKSKLELPLSTAHARLLDEAVAAGDGDLDNAAIIRRWRST
jgi:3-hydroxyisobutyrate dehydrogenase-like beta-hydroxyacid dehydrogenase